MNDWRLTDQIKYLSGKEFKYGHFFAKGNNDHSHCEFCWKKFYDGDPCYLDNDLYYTVCEDCYNDFKEKFGWK